MKTKSIIAALLIAASSAFAQVPTYVPTNGLVGWWPFNGNANDESGNGNNGTVYGATLVNDRFGNTGKAYSFNGLSNYIDCGNSNSLNPVNLTISVWVSQNTIPTNTNFQQTILGKTAFNAGEIGYRVITDADSKNYFIWSPDGTGSDFTNTLTNLSVNNWVNIISVKSGDTLKIYKNGMFENQIIYPRSPLNNNNPLIIGAVRDIFFPSPHIVRFYDGKIDDIGIWNRALTQNEITQLYTGSPCITYQTITVTDTLIINANLTGINPVTFQNSIKVYPNPASTSINIDFGSNYATLVGYSMRIDNSIGQTVYTTPVNQQLYTSNLNGWSGNGLYLIYLLNPQGAVVDVRKIIIQ